tara:strand:- start:4291 stop:4989 length:699 start_codon:yes stop_codon:yes gene_type:complete
MFDPFLEELHKSIREHGGEPLDLLDCFRLYQSDKTNSKIKSWLWNVPGFRRWRVTRLDAGSRLQVLNSVAYPTFNKDQPIMGMDLLWFGIKKKLVAVLDFQPLIQNELYFDKYYKDLQALKETFPEFNNQTKMNSYDPDKYFSPSVLFCKGGIKEAEYSLPIVFKSFLEFYWELDNKISNNICDLNPEEIKKLQINYDKYSAERDPAHGLFASFFGKKWSDHFLKEFLFPYS